MLALCVGGIEAVRVEAIAKQLGLSKGSFYHHFENRRALLLAVLDQWEQKSTSDIIAYVDSSSDRPADRLRALGSAAFHPDQVGDAIETRIRAWASTDPIASDAAGRVDRRRLDYVTELLVAGGMAEPVARRRALLLYRVLIGDTTWRLAGGPAVTAIEIEELATFMLGPARPTSDGISDATTEPSPPPETSPQPAPRDEQATQRADRG